MLYFILVMVKKCYYISFYTAQHWYLLRHTGWNDVGFHNRDMKTPNIDKLAAEGLVLNQTYLQPLCSP